MVIAKKMWLQEWEVGGHIASVFMNQKKKKKTGNQVNPSSFKACLEWATSSGQGLILTGFTVLQDSTN